MSIPFTRFAGPLLVLALALSVLQPAQAAQKKDQDDKLGKRDRALLAEANAQGESSVTLLIAATVGSSNTVAGALASLGATVQVVDSDVDYIRAVVPVGKVEAVARLSGVEAVDLDETVPLDDPRPDGSVPPTPQTPPSASTPKINPYMPIGDTGAAQFQATRQAWDGRGTTIGIVDSGVSLDHPSLQTTSTGERKIIDWVTYTHPLTDDDPTWVNMHYAVSGSSFTYQGVKYTAPAPGRYRIGVFNERDPRLGGEVGNDVNRDGNRPGSSGLFGVLWDLRSNFVWVDANQNQDFSDDPAMTDYKRRYDVGYFGTDDPATPVAERMPFVVQTNGKQVADTQEAPVEEKIKYLNIGIVSAAHGSHVAGITAANSMFGGAMSGAAPGAKLKSVRVCLFVAGCTSHAMVEGVIYIAKQAVDVINISIGGLPALNDGNTTRAVVYNRLIDKYKVQMFISAGNSGPGLNTVGDPSVITKPMSVGSYITRETWQKNYGSDSQYDDNMHYYSSRGPREDGGFKPQIVAPGSAISTTPLWQAGGPLPGTYALPPGYSMFNGTSMASPQAAGAAALLLGAAKQAGIQVKPVQLRQALMSSARYLDPSRFQAYDQGTGLINVPAAWNLLRANLKMPEISSSVPVNTVLSEFLATPGQGAGIYDREGVEVGQSYTRTYTFTRTSGGNGNARYNVSWLGNDGTFSSPSTLTLPLNTPTTLTVNINPRTVGAHSAILNLNDPGGAGIEYQTMNTVIAAEQFVASRNYSFTDEGSVGINQSLHYFFYVPAGTPAFKVDFSGPSATPGTGQARFLRFHPYGLGIDSNASTSCFAPPVPPPGTCSTGSPNSRTVVNPFAGVWEVTVDGRRTSDQLSVPFTLTASILGASVSPNPDVIPSATIGTPVERTYTITNLLGAFTGRATGSTLASARRGVYSIADAAQQEYDLTVTPGSTSLRATIGGTSDPGADLDLFVYNCTSGTCVLAAQSADGDSEESVTIANPAAGLWRVVVDGYEVPAGTTTYNYIDAFVNPSFGQIAVSDANALRPAGSSWTVPATITASAAPAAGRVLFGNVEVRTDTNVLVGSGAVIVESVAP